MENYKELIEVLRRLSAKQENYDWQFAVQQAMTEAADAIEKLQPKEAEWLPYEYATRPEWVKCSNCGTAIHYRSLYTDFFGRTGYPGYDINDYCRICGAKMKNQPIDVHEGRNKSGTKNYD